MGQRPAPCMCASTPRALWAAPICLPCVLLQCGYHRFQDAAFVRLTEDALKLTHCGCGPITVPSDVCIPLQKVGTAHSCSTRARARRSS